MKYNLNMIVAADKGYGIGKDGDLLYSFASDLQRFKLLTSGHVVVMGRKTWESLPKKLPGRFHVVLSRGEVPGADMTASGVEDVLRLAQEKEVWVIGGAQVYELLMPHVQKIFLTRISDTRECDTHVKFLADHLPHFRKEETETLQETDRISGKQKTIHFDDYTRKSKR